VAALVAIQALLVKKLLWLMIDRGLLAVLWMILVLWPALAAGFRPEGIEDDDDDTP
jgi:hypothetical protein